MNNTNHSGVARASHPVKSSTPIKLAKEQLSKLSRINPYLSTYHIVLEWGAVVLAAMLCNHFWSVFLYLATVAFIGARQHAMLILMHDGTHYRLFRNRHINDWISEVLLAWPHLVAMRSYRQNHVAHHNHVNTENDPDWLRKKDHAEWQFPQSVKSLLGVFARDLSGIGGINLIRLASSLAASEKAPSKGFKRFRLAFYLAVLIVTLAAGGGKILLLYWVVPYFTWLIFIMRIRSIAEHFAIEAESDMYGQTRTTYAGLLARVFIAPKNVNYHIEHHFFPSVPFHRLPQLHALLMSNPEFAGGAHVTPGYAKMLKECMRRTNDSEPMVRHQPAMLVAAAR